MFPSSPDAVHVTVRSVGLTLVSTSVGAAGGVTSAGGPEELTTALEELPPTEEDPPTLETVPVLEEPGALEEPTTPEEPPWLLDVPTLEEPTTPEEPPRLLEVSTLEEPTTPEEPPALLEVSTLEDPTTPDEPPRLLDASTLEDPTADDALPLDEATITLDEPLAWDTPLDAPTDEDPTLDPPLLDPEARLEEPTPLDPPDEPPWLLPRDEDTSPLEPPVEELEDELVSSVPVVVGHPVQNATANSAVACPNRRIIMVPPKGGLPFLARPRGRFRPANTHCHRRTGHTVPGLSFPRHRWCASHRADRHQPWPRPGCGADEGVACWRPLHGAGLPLHAHTWRHAGHDGVTTGQLHGHGGSHGSTQQECCVVHPGYPGRI